MPQAASSEAGPPRPRPLNELCAVVVGGTSGIGRATAAALLAAGAPRLRVVGRTEATAAAAAEELARTAPDADVAGLACDCRDGAAAEAMAEAAARGMGRLDLLATTAGGPDLPELLHRQPIGAIESVLRNHLLPNLNAMRAALGVMRAQPDGSRGGAIMAVASDAAKLATPGEAVIGACMAGIVQFVRTLAIEGKRDHIRANTVTPSLVEGTPLTERLMQDGTFAQKLFQKARPQAHLGPTYPEDLAALIVFLASPAAAKITGQAISVNGGVSAA